MIITKAQTEHELRRSLQLLVHRPGLSEADINQQVKTLLNHVKKRGLSLENCLVASDGGEMISCCLCVDSPGHTSAVYLPNATPEDQPTNVPLALLAEAERQARDRQTSFLQAIIPVNAAKERQVYREAGFQHLADLIYMESDVTQPLPDDRSPPAMTLQTYSAENHQLFARMVLESYEHSLDCVGLNGVRDIEDILATHRATGVFDPATWFVALADGEPAGVLLLSAIPEQSAYEVVYMGLRPSHRQKGYASALLAHAVRTARDRAALRLTLAVDVQNSPARRLYARFGFCEVARRSAWVRILRPSRCGQQTC